MKITQAKYRVKTSNGYEQIHLETSSEAVLMNSGETLEQKAQVLSDKAHSHNNSEVLNKLGENDSGALIYNGKPLEGGSGANKVEVNGDIYENESGTIKLPNYPTLDSLGGAEKAHSNHDKLGVSGKVVIEFNSTTNSLDFIFT